MANLIHTLETYPEYTRDQLSASFHDMYEAQHKLPELCTSIQQVIPVDGAPYIKPPSNFGTPQAQWLVQNCCFYHVYAGHKYRIAQVYPALCLLQDSVHDYI